MALGTVLTLNTSQRTALTPALRQSLNMLRLPAHDLIEHIRREAVENPLLKVSAPHNAVSAFDVALSQVAAVETLGETIRQQLAAMPLDPDVRSVAVYLSGSLSEEGYLETTAAESATALGIPVDLVTRGITALQSCEPTGVGARDLSECLLLQLVEKGVPPATAKIVLQNTTHLINRNWDALAGILGCTVEKVRALGELVRSLNPEPVTPSGEVLRPLVADIVVTNTNGTLSTALAGDTLPWLSVNQALVDYAKSDKSARDYLVQQRDRARNLIRAVKFRGQTLLEIGNIIANLQHRFFLDRDTALVPLNRTDIAGRMSLHLSTVGRAIIGKNLEFEGRIYPLDHFLTGAMKTIPGGTVSTRSIQNTIRRMVNLETPQSTLSDENIVTKLRAGGVDISRRTVAKYRGCMNIPSSFKRRKILAAQASHPTMSGSVPGTGKP
jgi:RNA polymerase sigma-54 factor